MLLVYTVGKFSLLPMLTHFHTSLFWVLILAAGGPYWVLISQKDGSLSQSLGVLISFRDSAAALSMFRFDMTLEMCLISWAWLEFLLGQN